MIEILRIENFDLNPNDNKVNTILRAIENNYGKCISDSNTSNNKHCPCSSYREGKGCCCRLYQYKPQSKVSYLNNTTEINNTEGD